MSNLINFDEFGGFRLEQPTLKKIQENGYLFLKAMIGHFGIPDVGNFIISGCTIDDVNITEGILYIDGHLCQFEMAAGTLDTKIKKVVTTQNLVFQNGTTPIVFTKYTAAIDAAGTPLSEFVRVPSPFNLPANIVIDANYVHTDSNFTADEKTKLAGIQEEAEKNVQADWNQTNATADDFIKNKPTGKLLTYLKQGVYDHGDLMGTAEIVTIAFGDVGTSNYKVLGTLIGSGSSWHSEARVNWVAREKTATSFKLAMHDLGDVAGQDLRFEYVLVPDDNS